VQPKQIHNWRKQLLDGAVSVFEGDARAEGATNEAQVDLLHRQIGQLKVENDLYGGFRVKPNIGLLFAAKTGHAERAPIAASRFSRHFPLRGSIDFVQPCAWRINLYPAAP
jgi:hypothetical protein